MSEQAYWIDEGESGPPSLEDDAWLTHFVASLNYPKGRRDLKPMEGQMSITDPWLVVSPLPTHIEVNGHHVDGDPPS